MYKTEAKPRVVTADGVPVFCGHDEILKIKDLKPNPKNPNQHNAKQIGLLATIIKSNGWRAPITVSKRSGYIVKGHGRRQAAISAGLKEVPVEYQDYATAAEENADLLADNRIAELSDIDNDKLMDMIKDTDFGEMPVELTGFTTEDLADILNEIENSDDEVEDDGADSESDTDEEIPPFTKPNDLWHLGDHRLLCGSATSTEDIDRLMNGDMAQLVHTDPPYGVSFVGSGRGENKFGMIKNDDKTDDALIKWEPHTRDLSRELGDQASQRI
nr:MAG TPA: ParB protein [Caudoviricetes sp.]